VKSVEEQLHEVLVLLHDKPSRSAQRVLLKLWGVLCDRAALQMHAAVAMKKAADHVETGNVRAAVRQVRLAARCLEIDLPKKP
jgi:hypothetical protein